MSNPTVHPTLEGEPPPAMMVGGRPIAEVEELLRRRRLSAHTVQMYLGVLQRAEVFCQSEDLVLDELRAPELARFVATLHQSRSVLSQARAALSHYWSAIGRRGYPSLSVSELIGRPSKDPLEGFVARDRAKAIELAAAGPGSPTWGEMAYDREWLIDKLRARQLAPRTARMYSGHLSRLATWCLDNGTTIDTVSSADVERYVVDQPNTRSNRMALRTCLIHYFAIVDHPDPPTWVIRVPRRTRMVCRALEDDAARDLEAAALKRDDRKGLAVVIGLYLGLRRFEIAKLEWLDFRDGWLHIVGKGDVEATIPVHQVVLDYLARHPNASPFVFPGRFGSSVNPTTLWGWVRDVSREAGLGEVATHILRHTALATGNDATGDLRSVQDFARHAEPTTTAGYTRTTKRRLIAVSDAIGGFYEETSSEDSEGVSKGPGPMTCFAELIRIIEGSHAVKPWLQIADILDGRPGWRLAGVEGESLVEFVYPEGQLSVSVIALTGDRPPVFSIDRQAGSTREDVHVWSMADAATLGALLATFEAGGVPFPPTATYAIEEEDSDDTSRV